MKLVTLIKSKSGFGGATIGDVHYPMGHQMEVRNDWDKDLELEANADLKEDFEFDVQEPKKRD